MGMLHSDRAWKSAAAELQAKIVELSHQSEITNTVIKEKVVTKQQVVKVRGQDIVKYIDREVVKGDVSCTVTPEFVQAHNRAAEAPK